MTEESTGELNDNAARAMLNCFASVGASHFDVTSTTRSGEKDWFRRNVPLAELTRTLPAMLDKATSSERNVIVRPHGPGITFLQLDDVAADRLPALAPAVFLTLETSSGNFQAWLARKGCEDKEFARRVRRGTGADATASGATRVAGSLNFKDKCAPAFPRVRIQTAQHGRVTDFAELERLGLVAPPEEFAPLHVSPARSIPGSNRKWPSYGIALDGAPLNSEETGPDVSRADFVWCMTAITWGFAKEETAERLMLESGKAKTQGKGYAELTVSNAALAVERRKRQPRSQHFHHT